MMLRAFLETDLGYYLLYDALLWVHWTELSMKTTKLTALMSYRTASYDIFKASLYAT